MAWDVCNSTQRPLQHPGQRTSIAHRCRAIILATAGSAVATACGSHRITAVLPVAQAAGRTKKPASGTWVASRPKAAGRVQQRADGRGGTRRQKASVRGLPTNPNDAANGILYVKVNSSMLVATAIADALPQLPIAKCKTLVSMGAVYYCRLGETRLERIAPTASPIGASSSAALATQVEFGGILRVHTSPRHFPACVRGGPANWVKRIICVHSDFVAVDKPPGVPCAPHVSNGREWLIPFVAAVLDASPPGSAPPILRPCHRLDIGTSGVILVARNVDFAERFRKLLHARTRGVQKWYRALVSGNPIANGTVLRHWISDSVFGRPGPLLIAPSSASVSESSHKWRSAITEVLECKRAAGGCWELLLKPLTGRTHQLRAQLAAVGMPIVFDTLYKPLTDFLWNSTSDDSEAEHRVHEAADATHGDTFALQAARLAFEDQNIEAPPPWWWIPGVEVGKVVVDAPGRARH